MAEPSHQHRRGQGNEDESLEVYLFNPREPPAIPGWELIEQLKGQAGSSSNKVRGEYYYYLDGDRLRRVEARLPNRYLRLHSPRPGTPPTIMINGILMHQIAKSDPITDAMAKARAARVRRGAYVLDVCTGLGYTTTAALELGARRVVTIEVDPAVLALAEYNPYSRRLSDERVTIILGDAVRVIKYLRSNIFDTIIHDPPRYSVAGELYSTRFYLELYRVLRPGGTLFHYTGEPMKTRGRGHGPIVRGVIERLRSVGFRVIGFNERAQGVVAKKPR